MLPAALTQWKSVRDTSHKLVFAKLLGWLRGAAGVGAPLQTEKMEKPHSCLSTGAWASVGEAVACASLAWFWNSELVGWGEAVTDTDIMGCGSLCHFFPCKVRDYWETRERKGRNCFSVRQLRLRYWLLSTHFFSAFLSHIDFIGATEVTGSAINLHFLPELLSLVIKSSKAECILLCDEKGQGSPRYICIAWFYKLNKDHLGTWVTLM